MTQLSLDLGSMEAVFQRSFEMHTQSMSAMLKTMSVEQAMDVLAKGNLTSPDLLQIGNLALGKRGNLRSSPTNSLAYSGALAAGQGAKGYSGLDNARKLLNDMIYEAELKYEEEIHQCTEFYSVKCAALQAGQSDLLASNFLAASSRTLMASATTTIKLPCSKFQ